MLNTNMRRILITSASLLALGGCNGANDIASPGSGGNITITYPAPTPTPTPTPTPVSLVTPAGGCPTINDPQGLEDRNTITGVTGTYRVCRLPAKLNVSSTLPQIDGLVYEMNGRVDVGTDGGAAPDTGSGAARTSADGILDTNVTLTIAPGAILFAGTPSSFLAVNRGNKIMADGTASKPIIFTSRDNVLGINEDTKSSGQWGGVVLLGRAPVTDCIAPAATPGTVACERDTEGLASGSHAYYGGAVSTDSSGSMTYVQIRYSGYAIAMDSELQSLTPSGVGSGTHFDYFQSFNSSDDGAEFFGGHVNFKHYIAVGAEDDSIDTDTGLKANFQYVIVAQRQGFGDAILEADTDNITASQTPRQNTKISNFVFYQKSPNNSDKASILFRGQTDYSLFNGVLVSPDNPCLRFSDPQTVAAAGSATDEAGPPVFKSVLMQCGTTKYVGSTTNGTVLDTQVQTIFGAGTNGNSDTYVPTLTDMFINGATETAATPFDAHTVDTFFDTTDYIGAVKQGATPWYNGWTCNSSAASFGTGNTGLCTSLPTA